MGNFEESDIETAKKTIISGITQISDSPASIIRHKFKNFLAGVEETMEMAIEKIQSITKEEIIEAAQKVRIDTVYFLGGNGEEDEYEDE